MIKLIKPIKSSSKPKLLLHTCCACCATEAYNRLKDEYRVTLFWYNPNIYPHSEYKNRLDSFKKLVNDLNADFICHSHEDGNLLLVDPRLRGDDQTSKIDQYQIGNTEWQKDIAGLENEPEGGKRCTKCYQFRLEQTAKVAEENGFDIFATTLTISPHKNAATINRIGKKIATDYQIDYLESDFKKQDGFKKSIELSHKHNLYRQNYCGCKYSIRSAPPAS